VLCNIADRPDASSFILPAIVNRGDLVITISTSGKSPAYAKHLRKEMEKQYGAEQEDFLRLMGEIRKKFLADTTDKHEFGLGKERFWGLINRGLVELIKKGDKTGIKRLLHEFFGDGYEFESLMKNAASRRPSSEP
jgi:precorrin-2 dehydrogenase/sirohydrochlorin ferrochelatase